ncbi:hypothetical protein [Parascardovia denticolens]|nr:hypothetical protein [Parascardovia denticolens]
MSVFWMEQDPTSQAGGSQRPAPAQPEAGQAGEPAYGQMASKYPGWDPYVYGRPDEDSSSQPKGKGPESTPSSPMPAIGSGPGSANGLDSGQGQRPGAHASDQNRNAGQGGPFDPRQVPTFTNRRGQQIPVTELDPDNPDYNPLYGRWSAMAIWSLVLTILNLQPLGVFLALIAIPRIRHFHMKGLAIAIISIVLLVVEMVLLFLWIRNGHTIDDIYAWYDTLLNQMRQSD